MKLTAGFDDAIKKLKDVEKFTEGLNGHLDRLSFEATDPSSIEQAIRQAEDVIDSHAARYPRNQWVEAAAASFKEQVRTVVITKAQAFRLESGE